MKTIILEDNTLNRACLTQSSGNDSISIYTKAAEAINIRIRPRDVLMKSQVARFRFISHTLIVLFRTMLAEYIYGAKDEAQINFHSLQTRFSSERCA